MFAKEFLKKKACSLGRTLWQTTSASIIIGVISYFMLNIFDNIFDINTFWGVLQQGLYSGLIGLAIGITYLALIKNQEIHEIYRALHTKFWRTPVVTENTSSGFLASLQTQGICYNNREGRGVQSVI